MKVLWFEVTEPANYSGKSVRGGWQDSLESIVKKQGDIELIVSFEGHSGWECKNIDGVTYEPLSLHYSKFQRFANRWSYKHYAEQIEKEALRIVKKHKPDIIHVFGTEWPFGLVAKHTNIPVIIHVQGSIIAYNNADYPPKYDLFSQIKANNFNPKTIFHRLCGLNYNQSRERMEASVWKLVNNYMGRTVWDKAMVNTLNPNAKYFHVDEAIRPLFLNSSKIWEPAKIRDSIQLITTGAELRKGLDVVLKTARILKDNEIPFKWIVAGSYDSRLIKTIETIQKDSFFNNNVKFVGPLNPTELIAALTRSTMYIHTAYAENSPNSICEAQLLGVPVVSTMVGGIATLVRNGIDGELVPANDPWQLADTIINLSKKPLKLKEYSKNSYDLAHNRHNPERIVNQLLDCYREVISSRG